ncbi:Alpha-ketoglutarate-dependent dioxygenase FTO [Triplophysa tibetana]|uniref:Alpha-ketoglutarate-dependent dioxygenase FTO n=1 Tax=Triplophysa tibetana TaxID=1572043 RepID=A0A5A9PML7_9TELE|nr:Alpha-ketoglutarate-dependent dioxygenase FTO [Triplophysa tibetana]
MGEVDCILKRCQSSLAQTLPPEEAPVDRPFWSNEDPDMPLPFDLSDIISRVESLQWSEWTCQSRDLLPVAAMTTLLSVVRVKRLLTAVMAARAAETNNIVA